jgi:UDP-N-acetylglucosamine 2-epimerase (non-hydrolysing)
MLKQIASCFAIEPDYDLQLMAENQNLHELTSKVLLETRKVIQREFPEAVIVQGDTTTAFASSLSAFYLKVPVAHVEAGLRTGDIYAPYPEEGNRALLSRLARIHFVPTTESRDNLLREGIADSQIVLTGNTVIDALRMMVTIVSSADRNQILEGFPDSLRQILDSNNRIVLITGHRREHFGSGLRSICEGIERVAKRFPDISFVYPVHFNPNVRRPVRELLSCVNNVYLIEPLDYIRFVFLLKRAYFILTDSGGIQEEAPALGKPVLVMREATERPEAVAMGTAILVGTDVARIERECVRLIEDQAAYNRMSKAVDVFGDGRASERIAEALCDLLQFRNGANILKGTL